MNFKKYRGLIIGIIITAILFSLWMWDIRKGKNDNKIIHQQELTEIRGTLSNKPTIETAEQGGPWVPIKLKEYPDFKFDIGEVKYPALKSKDFTEEASIGDSIVLYILIYDYETKIKKEKALRPSETLINYKLIEPYSIQSKDKTYLTLADVNKAWQDNHDTSWWMLNWILGLGIIVGIVYMILYWTGFIKKFGKWWDDVQASR